MRIGIFGGTFDPIHNGHLKVAQKACAELDLEKVIFIPTNITPDRQNENIASAQDRLEMVRLASGQDDRLDVSDCEIKRGGISYSIDTVQLIRDQYPEKSKLFFIIGGDRLDTLHTWKDIDTLKKIVTFVVVNRPDFGQNDSDVRAVSLTMPGIDISSTDLRQRLKSHKSIKGSVPKEVDDYIEKEKLYR